MMQPKRNRSPRWNILYLIPFLAVGLFILERQPHFSPAGHKIVLILVIAIVYSLIALWLKSNTTALAEQDNQEFQQKTRNPAVYGTPEFPTRVQAHFQAMVAHYSPDEQTRRK